MKHDLKTVGPRRGLDYIVLAAALICWGGVAVADAVEAPKATVHFHAGVGGINVTESNGQPLLLGSEVRLGVLPDDFNFAQLSGQPAEVGRQWQTVGTAAVRPLFGQPGRFAAVAEGTDGALTGRKLYIWLLRTSDGLPARADYANVTAHALVTSALPHWRLPAPTALPPGNMILLALNEAETVIAGVRNAGALAVSVVTPPSIGQTYAEWSVLAIVVGDRSPTADNDNDGRINLLEFFLGGNPTVRDHFPLSVVSVAQGRKTYLEMTFRIPRDVQGVTWTVEGSSDTVVWLAITEIVVTDRGDGTNQVVARDNIATEDAGGKRFLRLNVRL